jgi:hypothetical protein
MAFGSFTISSVEEIEFNSCTSSTDRTDNYSKTTVAYCLLVVLAKILIHFLYCLIHLFLYLPHIEHYEFLLCKALSFLESFTLPHLFWLDSGWNIGVQGDSPESGGLFYIWYFHCSS